MRRRLKRLNKKSFDCRNGIMLKKDRTRIYTCIDRRRYTCSIKQLQRLLDKEIEVLTMTKYTGSCGGTGYRIKKTQRSGDFMSGDGGKCPSWQLSGCKQCDCARTGAKAFDAVASQRWMLEGI